MAFDDEGRLIGSNTQDIFRTASATGTPALWVPGVPNRSALRHLSDGRIAVVQEMFRRVLVLLPDGSSKILASNLDYPFGLVEDLDGAVFIADNSRIMRVDPESGDAAIWLETPNFVSRWISFDVDYDGMFVGGRTNTIHWVPIDESGQAGAPFVWGTLPVPASDEGHTLVDGLGVDACGNVYAAEFYSKGLYRIPDGGGVGEQLVEWSEIEYGHGLQWGSGMGDWSETSLFLPQPYNAFNVVQVEIGVPSKPRP
ncbi:SMP-30/gluconolactonase/LRE family protein [Nannocystaceae bacterium ST9]